MIQLKNKVVVEDPRLDRIPEFDEQSRQYPIRTIVPKKPRSYTWSVSRTLDQGQEGACVGFSWSHELMARPKIVIGVSDDYARGIYREAQKIDEWAGEDYEGTSVLAGAKVVSSKGFLSEYRWAFGLEDLILAVGYAGPAIIGVNWYTGMFEPDETGYIHKTGYIAGGHAILCKGVNIKGKYFKLHNSWGADWGNNGECLISFDDMNALLHEQGEACIPVKRIKKESV